MPDVVWSDTSLEHLARIRDYIEMFDAAAAARIADRLIHVGESLRDFPERGRPTADGVREMVTVRPYVLRYAIVRDVVVVLGIRHSAQAIADDLA